MKKSLVNSYGNRRSIHLYHHPRKTKKRGVIHEYSLATCYYQDGKNQKKILQGIGELTDKQADQYRLILKGLNGQIDISGLTDLSSLLVTEEKRYLDVLAMDSLWNLLGIDKIFDTSTDSGQRASTEQIARILTINKLLNPSSKIKTIDWFGSTLLSKIMGIEVGCYERNKIFRELTKIHAHKNALEKAFWKYSKNFHKKYDAYYFDGSTSWFEDSHCSLAEADLEKTRGFFPKVVGLMLITDNRGFPVAWEVVDGHSKDTTVFKDFVHRISKDFGIEEITYCFDRGVASVNNFDLIEDVNAKFVSAIRDNQIKHIFDLDKFKNTRLKITEYVYETAENEKKSRPKRSIPGVDGFLSFDDNLFFKDLGITDEKRYIASFNFEIFISAALDRNRRLQQALLDINEKNVDLAAAKKDRDFNVTERDLLDILSKNKVRDFFTYKLLPLNVGEKTQSFKIECQIDKEKIELASLTDGLLLYISNHTEKKKNGEFELHARDLTAHYKGKHVVENAFREFKSFLELRPFFVWTEEHVKAHYDICIIACFINNYIAVKMRDLGVSLRDFHQSLEMTSNAVEITAPTGLTIFKIKTISDDIRRYFDELKIPSAYSPALHKRHGIFQ